VRCALEPKFLIAAESCAELNFRGLFPGCLLPAYRYSQTHAILNRYRRAVFEPALLRFEDLFPWIFARPGAMPTRFGIAARD
jgi:hypothetical protein